MTDSSPHGSQSICLLGTHCSSQPNPNCKFRLWLCDGWVAGCGKASVGRRMRAVLYVSIPSHESHEGAPVRLPVEKPSLQLKHPSSPCGVEAYLPVSQFLQLDKSITYCPAVHSCTHVYIILPGGVHGSEVTWLHG